MHVDTETATVDANKSRPNIGLVLEGGGAKGAFQFGCLYALHEEGVQFDAVSGTSVGGLNSAIWSTGQMEWGLQFWRSISFAKVYPLRKPLFVFMPLALVYATIKAVEEWLSARADHRYVVGMSLTYIGAGFVLMLLATVAVLVTRASLPNASFWVQWVCFGAVISPLVFMFAIERYGVSGFTPKPLETTLTDRLRNAQFRIPTFATVAIAKDIYDPDNLFYGTTGVPPSRPIYVPSPKREYVPDYIRLDTANANVIRTLLATAALPFGIVPAVDGAVDGGLADNMPVYPLTTAVACERLLVIRANADVPDAEELHGEWSRIERLLRIQKYDVASAHFKNPKQKKEWTPEKAEPAHLPNQFPEVFVIAMQAGKKGFLRDFIGGTMNFTACYATSQFCDGYLRTRSLLKSDEFRRFVGLTVS